MQKSVRKIESNDITIEYRNSFYWKLEDCPYSKLSVCLIFYLTRVQIGSSLVCVVINIESSTFVSRWQFFYNK